MITITSSGNSAEDRAGRRIRDLILAEWPDAESLKWQIRIIPSAKLWTESTKDIDVLVMVYSTHPRELSFGLGGRSVFIRSLCLTIEVKDNSDFQFRGNQLWVRYGSVWESTSEQAERQKFALRDYLRRQNIRPFVYSLIWLRPAQPDDIADCAENVLSGSASWTDFLQAVARTNLAWLERSARPTIDSRLDSRLMDTIDSLFTRVLQPSDLNRQKIEEICKGKLHGQKYDEKMGQQMLLFTGRGGTGKTITLLRTAWDLYEKRDRRILLLTYNHALRADIERVLLLLGMKNGGAGRNITIRTADKFLKDLVGELGFTVQWEGDDFEMKLSAAVRRAVGALRQPSDAQLVKVDELMGRKEYAWDFVMVDEGQDWPSERRDLLVELYGAKRLVIADGIDQLVQTTSSVNWTEGVLRDQYQRVPLWRSLRLKYNLSSFVKRVAESFGFHEWRLEPDSDIKVGRVVIVVGALDSAMRRVQQLMADAVGEGNSPVDLLFCVPSDYCAGEGEDQRALATPVIENWGYETWDGVNESIRRKTFPTSLGQVRIVQYDSSRGLEGWAVYLMGLDLFYERKLRQFAPVSEHQDDLFTDPRDLARQFAAQWIMIPLTRAIDTLVIHLASDRSELYRVLREADENAGRLAQWVVA